jgi:hypothetical protein
VLLEKFSWAIDKAADRLDGTLRECGDSRARCLEHANNLRRAWHRLIVVRTLSLAGLSRMGVATCLDSRSVHRCAVRQAKATTVRPAPG